MTGFTFHILKLNTIAALIICAACIVSRLTRKKYTCKWKYFVWLVTALALLVPVDLSPFSRVQLQIVQPTRQTGMRQNFESATAADQNALAVSDRHLSSDDTADTAVDHSSAPSSQTGLQDVPSFSAVSAASGTSSESGTSAAPLVLSLHSPRLSLYGFLQLFSCIWLTGFVLLAAFRILKYRFSLWSLRRWSSPVQNSDVVYLYRSICRREHISAPPRLMENRNLSTPVLAGLFHPALYLTEAPYDREELSFILRHELAHYKRRDLWFKLLLLAVSTIYWFNPALYLMRSEAEKDIENLCDGRVLQSSPMQSRLHYSQLLLKTAALQNHIPYLSASLNDSKLVFKERIHYLTELASLRRGTPLCLMFCAFLLTGNLAIGSSVLPTQAQSATDLSADSATVSENSASVLAQIDARASANAAQNTKNSDSTLTSSGTNSPGTASPADHDAPVSGQSPDTTENPGGTTGENPDNPDPVSQGTAPNHADPGNADTPPESPDQDTHPGSDSALPSLTDTRITLYALQATGATYVWQASDGSWYDGDYRKYVPNGDGTFTCSDNQSLWTSETPPSPADHASASVSLISEDGLNVNQLYYDSDTNIWQNIAGGIYTSNGDGTFTGPNGDLWIVTS